MPSLPKWLPELIAFDGDWEQFVEIVYEQYCHDFLRQTILFEGQRLSLRRQPLVREKEASFWHLVSDGDKEEERLPDLQRCKRIGWARAVIDNASDLCIKKWENKRGSNVNVCLWLEEANYLVVLGKRNGYTLLLTAYTVAEHKRKKLEKEYEEFFASQNS
jgi:hypothetical protein